jgi:hypothetical protein
LAWAVIVECENLILPVTSSLYSTFTERIRLKSDGMAADMLKPMFRCILSASSAVAEASLLNAADGGWPVTFPDSPT